ncbi:hypothetical protein ABPG72_010231 [Tetrahymena utriculariae]
MAIKLPEIPIIEDIYDFDTITLREVTEKVQLTLQKIDNLEQKEQGQILWVKKAKRYLELALQEIEERKAIENFGNYCVSNNDSILMSNVEDTSGASDSSVKRIEYQQNNQAQTSNKSNQKNAFGNIDEWIKLHQQISQQSVSNSQNQQEKKSATHQQKHYSVPQQINESEEEEDDENEQSTHQRNKYDYTDQRKLNSQNKFQDNEDGDDDENDYEEEDNLHSASVMKKQQSANEKNQKNYKQVNNDFCNNSIISGKSGGSHTSSQLKYIAHHKRLKTKSKQEEMQEFIRQTLEKTKITQSSYVGGSSGYTQQYFNKSSTQTQGEESSDGTEISIPKKKTKSVSSAQVTATSLPKRQSLSEKVQPSNEYAGVQSRIKMDLEQQRLKKLETPYFTTGKASYPKYKPPKQKKVDPDEEKKNRTKNFLKKSQPSVSLPPINQKKPAIKSGSADNSSVNGSESENKKSNTFISRATSVTTTASTDNLSEKVSAQNVDLSNIIGDDHNQDSNKQYKKPFSDKNISNEFFQNQQQGEIIQEEINENNNESDPEQHQKSIPGQPRKITKGELFRIKSTRSATSDKSSKSQMGESVTPSKFDFSDNPQQFIEEDISNQGSNNELRDKLIKTKSRSSLHSLKNTVNIEDSTKTQLIEKHNQEIQRKVDGQKVKINNEHQNISKSNEEESNLNELNAINNNYDYEKQKQNAHPIIPSIIPPEKEGILSIKTILYQDDKSNNNVVQRREADENPTDSEDDLNEEERLLLYNKQPSDDNVQTKKEDKLKEQQTSDGEFQESHLEDQEKELLQNNNRKGSIKELSLKNFDQKQYMKYTTETNVKSKSEIKFQDEKEDKEEEDEDYLGEDQLDEDEQLLVDNQNLEKGQEYELVEKYEKDSKQIVINAKKILENRGINEQLKNRMEKLLNNFQQNEKEVQEIEQSFKQVEEQHKKHSEEVKKNKNQIFGVPSKKKPESPLITGASNKVASKKENEYNKGVNAQDPKEKKGVNKTQENDQATQQKSKEERTGNDITNNTEKKQNQFKGNANTVSKAGEKKIKSKEELELEALQLEQEQFLKEQKQIMKKKATATAAPKPRSMTSKLLMKMMKEISDDNLIDYTQTIPSFFHIFSGYYNQIWSQNNPMMGGNVGSSININIAGGGGVNFCLIDAMRDIYSLFQQHVEKVDNADKGLLRYKQVVTPLEVLPSEVYYVNDPQKVIVYQNRVDIDIKKFIERQIIFTQRMNGENFAGHLLPHEEFYYRVVKSKPEVYDIITRSFMRKKDWFELPHGLQLRTSWNLLWTWSKPQIDFNKLLLFQKVNHFPFNKNLVRKDLLKKNFERITKLGQKAAQAFNILPLTFVLPKEYCNFSERFYEEMLREGENNIWIMKPVGKSQGRGISLVNDIAQVVYAEPVVVQKYMKDPLLLDGYKFDMRIYALITHMKPLEAFVYKEGFARLSTEKYQLNAQTIKNNYIHLTNFSIQKHHYDPASNNNFIGGTKISLKMLQEKFRQKGIDWDRIWIQVQEIIVKSVLACQADIPNNPNCFEIFGYDIIIDSSLKCCLLEINSSPSLARDFIIDDLIKQQMVDDAIDLVSPVQFDRLRLLEVLDRRIREEQGNKSNINTTNNSKLQLNRDLNYILRGQKLRQFGETPAYLGQWLKVAPTEMSDKYLKIIQSYKLPSVRQNTANAANNNNTID